jgi:hypothetical protein
VDPGGSKAWDFSSIKRMASFDVVNDILVAADSQVISFDVKEPWKAKATSEADHGHGRANHHGAAKPPPSMPAIAEDKSTCKDQADSDDAENGSAWDKLGFAGSMAPIARMASFDVNDLWSTASAWKQPPADAISKKASSDPKSGSTWDRLGFNTSLSPMESMESMAKALNSKAEAAFASIDRFPGDFSQPTTFDRAERPPAADDDDGRPKVLRTNVTLPQVLSFALPEDIAEGQQHLWITGPHGPMQVPLPSDARPGQEMKVRIGPKNGTQVTIPLGFAEGDLIPVDLPNGERIQAPAPAGKKPGDEFDVFAPSLMVHVPKGAKPGRDSVVFMAPSGRERTVPVPRGASPGQYFDVPVSA